MTFGARKGPTRIELDGNDNNNKRKKKNEPKQTGNV